MNTTPRPGTGAQRGMSLIEVLVGVAIGLIGMLVIFQTLTVWDARTRATSAGNDAQVTGAVAMYNLERDLRLAGLGIATREGLDLGCTVNGWDNVASAAKSFPFQPVRILDNDATGLPDEIAILYGNSPYFADRQPFDGGAASHALVTTYNRIGFKAGDVAVLVGTSCDFVLVTDEATTADKKTLSFINGTYADYYKNGASVPARFNAASGIGGGYAGGGLLFNLGPVPHFNNWKVQPDGTLGFSDDFQLSQFFGIAEGVAGFKAQYGYDTNFDGRIDDTEWTKTLPPTPDWTRLRAVRVAIAVRSRNFEKPGAASSAQQNYSAPNPTYTASPASGPVAFVMRNVDGTADSHAAGDPSPNNWRNYRYTVYERVIPIRNVAWGAP